MVEFVEVPVGTGGGVRCLACDGADPERFADVESVLGEVGALVDSWGGGPGPNIVLTGPEPFRMPGFSTVVSGVVERGVRRLSVRTDGASLARADNAPGSVTAGVRHLEVTLLGGSAEKHDRLSGVPGSLEAAVEGMRAFIRAGADLGVPVLLCGRIPLGSHNVKDLPAMVLAFADVRANSVTVSISPRVPTPVARPWVDAAIETGIINGVWVTVEGRSAEELRVHPLHGVNPAPCRARDDGDAS